MEKDRAFQNALTLERWGRIQEDFQIMGIAGMGVVEA